MKLKYYNILVLTLAGVLTGCSKNDLVLDDEGLLQNDVAGELAAEFDVNPQNDNSMPAVPEGMKVVFEDDFEGASETPDESKWVLCKKSTSNWARHLSESYDQAYQKDGYLYLIGEMSDGEYLTGGIETRGKFEFQFGKVECRAKFLTRPKGNHTGIWMMPAPPAEQWPKSGEIDIMEHLNDESVIYETAHSWYADDMGHKEDPVSQKTAEVNNEEWNIYGLEWDEDYLVYTVNGEEHLRYPNLRLAGEDGTYQWPFNHPFYIILSQSLGGEDTWAGPIDDAELPAIFQIDWIRVCQKDNQSGVPKIMAE